MEHVPWEVFLFIIAAIIAVIQKVWEASREIRRKSMERERREGRATLEDEPPPSPATRRAPPAPARRPARPPGPLLPPPPARPRPTARPPRPEPPRPAPRPAAPVRAPAHRSIAAATRVTRLRRQHHLLGHVHRMLRDRDGGIRDAVILREVLGPPRALRRAPWIR